MTAEPPESPATAASSWLRKIQRTSRLRTPSVAGPSGSTVIIVVCS